MLDRKNRLTKKSEFEKVREEGKVFASDSFSLSILKREEEGPARFGFVVSNKISKAATIRNRAKRALREGVRHSLAYAKNGYDCVFLAKPIIVKKYTDELIREVQKALNTAEVTN